MHDGFCYETQHRYLERLNLLTEGEKEIFDKYGDVVQVRIASEIFGKCELCWKEARGIAAEIGFDLDAAIERHEFWIPEVLFFDCEHEERFNGIWGIFEDLCIP